MATPKATPVTKTHNGVTYTYTVPGLLAQHGFVPMTLDKEPTLILVCEVTGTGPYAPKLWDKNPRITEELKGASQKDLKKALNEMPSSKMLEEALDENGGQCDFLWLHQNKLVEGNRRGALMLGKYDRILVNVLPDNTPEEKILAFVSKKHLAGPEEWESAMRSLTAFRFKNEYGWPVSKIRKHFQFKSDKEVNKYIGAYEWLNRAMTENPEGISIKDWSKFHHAHVPTIIHHFKEESSCHEGYDSNFAWFCHLITDGLLTDCRQSDGVVGPLLRDNDEDGLAVLENKGAEEAWTYLKKKRKGSVTVNKLQDALEEIEGIVNSIAKCRMRQNDPTNETYREERLTADLLTLRLSDFLRRTKPLADREEEAARN